VRYTFQFLSQPSSFETPFVQSPTFPTFLTSFFLALTFWRLFLFSFPSCLSFVSFPPGRARSYAFPRVLVFSCLFPLCVWFFRLSYPFSPHRNVQTGLPPPVPFILLFAFPTPKRAGKISFSPPSHRSFFLPYESCAFAFVFRYFCPRQRDSSVSSSLPSLLFFFYAVSEATTFAHCFQRSLDPKDPGLLFLRV